MKKIALSFTLFCMATTLACAQVKITFAATKHEFGNIKEADGDVSHVFTFKNTGNAPLVIKNVETSCGCTSPDWTKEPVMPGKSGVVKATFSPAGRPGRFDKNLTVITNAQPERTVLYISGNVAAKVKTTEEEYPFAVDALRLKSGTLDFYRVLSSGTKTDNLEALNTGSIPAVVHFDNVPAHVSIVSDPVSIPAGGKATIKCTYNAAKRGEFGPVTDELSVRVSKVKRTLKIRANIEEDFSKLTPAELEKAPVLKVAQTTHKFNTVKKGEKVTGDFELKNEGKTDLLIRKVGSNCDCLKPVLAETTIRPGKSAVLKAELVAPAEAGTKFYEITVTANSPKQRQIVLYMTGTVE
ncbi:MAG: DUF1573 domain-containing protein [Prevotellaceae bacterium]|nr:DUF1573 domain-containing protein [Prevotellaceae bacterium]